MNSELAKRIILPTMVFFAILAVWSSIATIVEDFPTPKTTYVAAFGGVDVEGDEVIGVLSDPFYIENEDDKGIFWQILASLERVFGGFALAIIVGVPMGLLIGMSKSAQYAFDPFIQIFKPVSPLAWLPLLLFIFQDINMTAISTIFITSIWPIIINTALGVRSVSEDYLNVAKVLQFNALEKVTQIILPVAVPFIFTGMRLSLGIAWLVIVAAEMLTGGIGIGFWIWDEYNNLAYRNIIIGIILVGLVGFLLDLIMGKVEKAFPIPGKEPYVAVTDVDLEIKKNEIVSIIGHSGCGKSTLLNMIAGLDMQTKGYIFLKGKEIKGPGPNRAVVFQNHSLLPWLTVYQNIEMAVKKVMPELDPIERKERVNKFVSMVNLEPAKDKLPGEISGGMKQRVGIARALSIQPDVLLMDEPFGALDSLTRANLQEHLMRIQQKVQNTVVIITHDVDEAVLLSDRVIMMTNGPEATIGEILEVNLDRPRNRVELQHDPEYIRCREAILSFLYEKFAKEDE